MRVALKYCGSCNPKVDLDEAGSLVRAWVNRRGHALVPWREEGVDLLVFLSGCERRCAEAAVDCGQARRVARGGFPWSVGRSSDQTSRHRA